MEKSRHTLTLEGGGQTQSYVIFSKSIYYIIFVESARSSGLAGIIFNLRLEGKKRIRLSCFLLVLIYVKLGILV